VQDLVRFKKNNAHKNVFIYHQTFSINLKMTEWTTRIIDFWPLSMTVGGCMLATSKRNGRRGSGRFCLEEHLADFKLFMASIDTFFVMEHNKGAFCYTRPGEIWGISVHISGRENAFGVTRLANMPCRKLLAKI
jgi:hypothetical protein